MPDSPHDRARRALVACPTLTRLDREELLPAIVREIEAAVAEEREACARIAEHPYHHGGSEWVIAVTQGVADGIRGMLPQTLPEGPLKEADEEYARFLLEQGREPETDPRIAEVVAAGFPEMAQRAREGL